MQWSSSRRWTCPYHPSLRLTYTSPQISVFSAGRAYIFPKISFIYHVITDRFICLNCFYLPVSLLAIRLPYFNKLELS